MLNTLSTIPPPLGLSALGLITSTTEPPRSTTQNLLQALAGNGSPMTPLLLRLSWLLQSGLLPVLPARRTTPQPTLPAQAAERIRLETRSPDVILMLATQGFWAGTRVDSAGEWTPAAGVPAVDVTVTHGAFTRSLSLPSVTFADYQASVAGVPATMAAAPPRTDLRVAAEAESPQVLFAMRLGMHRAPALYPYTAALIDAVTAHVAVAVQVIKHRLVVPRPDDPAWGVTLPNLLLPMPGYSAYPSGHSTICHALVEVLAHVIEASTLQRAALFDLAETIAVNRERAGLHCSADTAAGALLGQALGQWMLAVADDANQPLLSWSAVLAAAAEEWQ